jgi:atypical dual specificity phosphatase
MGQAANPDAILCARARAASTLDAMRPNPSDWLVEGSILACVYPDDERGLPALERAGISVVINLHDQAHDPAALARHGLTEVHLPVLDFTPPTAEQLDAGVAAIERALAEGRRVAVHCAGGLGRTGALLACYLVRQGSSPSAAIARVRATRPGSVETPAQEAAVTAFAKRLRRQADQ